MGRPRIANPGRTALAMAVVLTGLSVGAPRGLAAPPMGLAYAF